MLALEILPISQFIIYVLLILLSQTPQIRLLWGGGGGRRGRLYLKPEVLALEIVSIYQLFLPSVSCW